MIHIDISRLCKTFTHYGLNLFCFIRFCKIHETNKLVCSSKLVAVSCHFSIYKTPPSHHGSVLSMYCTYTCSLHSVWANISYTVTIKVPSNITVMPYEINTPWSENRSLLTAELVLCKSLRKYYGSNIEYHIDSAADKNTIESAKTQRCWTPLMHSRSLQNTTGVLGRFFFFFSAGELEGGTRSHACTDKEKHKHRCHGRQPNFVWRATASCAPLIFAAFSRSSKLGDRLSGGSAKRKSLRSQRELFYFASCVGVMSGDKGRGVKPGASVRKVRKSETDGRTQVRF